MIQGFGSLRLVKEHRETVHGEKSLSCSFCDDMFTTSILLKSHTANAHDMSKPYHCPSCAKTFNSSKLLQRHVARIHEMRNCKMCPHCKKQYSRLYVHLKTCKTKLSLEEG